MKETIAIVIPAYNEAKNIVATLDAAINQSLQANAIIVVDNASTDNTFQIIKDYVERHNNIYLIREVRKGTGFACDTGFRYAIDKMKATIICRTDADSLPSLRWIESISFYFAKYPKKQFIAGSVRPRTDDTFYRWYDNLVWRPYWRFLLVSGAIVRWELFLFRFGFGGNLAIRSKAYDAVGGFTHTDIGENDEDHSLNAAVYKHFGFRAMGFVKEAIVFTSTRRIRKIGYLGIVPYYAFSDKKRRLKKMDGNIDAR